MDPGVSTALPCGGTVLARGWEWLAGVGKARGDRLQRDVARGGSPPTRRWFTLKTTL